MSYAPRFWVGGLELTGAPFWVEQQATDLGSGENVSQVIDTLLADGEFLGSDRTSNRAITLTVGADHADLDEAALNEALLISETDRQQNTFTVDPGDGEGVRTVFQTFRIQVKQLYREGEDEGGVRRYSLTIPALPFGFSESEVVTVASTPPPATVTTVVMSDGTSASGWSSPAGWPAQPTVVGGAVFVRTLGPIPGGTSPNAEATFAFAATDFTTTKYLYVDVKAQASAIGIQSTGDRSTGLANEPYLRKVWLFVDGATTPLEQFSASPNMDGSTRYAWVVTGSAVTSLKFRAGAQNGSPSGVYFDNLTRTNAAPGQSATGRQSLRTVSIPGSARTAASVTIEHATQGLGRTIHYTSSALGVGGYQPNLVQYAVIADGVTSTGDAATVSGSYKRSKVTAGSGRGVEFLVPVSVLPPGRPYLIVGRLRAAVQPSVTLRVTATVSQIEGATAYGATTLPNSYSASNGSGVGILTAFDDFTIFGVTTLPPQDVSEANSNALVRISLLINNTQANNYFDVDELWAFEIGEGADITIANCGTGTPALGTVHNRLFIDSPTPNDPSPNLMVGTAADRSDAFDPGYPAVAARGVHPVTPPQAQAFVVTAGATYPTVTYRVLPAWFTHAAKLPEVS